MDVVVSSATRGPRRKAKVAAVILLALVVSFVVVAEAERRVAGRSLVDNLIRLNWAIAPVNLPLYWATAKKYRGSPFFPINAETFPNEHLLHENFEMIQREARGVAEGASLIKKELFFGRIADEKWKRHYLKWYGPGFDPRALEECPGTCALLAQMPEVKLAMFSIMEAGAQVKPHSGPFRGCLRYHLGVETPNDDACFIEVAGQRYSWRDNEGVLLDDVYPHYVQNNTDKRRIVLFLDVVRPVQGKFAKALRDFTIKHLAPLSTRANDKVEKRSAVRPPAVPPAPPA